MQYLIGMSVTLFSFVLMVWFINRTSDKKTKGMNQEFLEGWKTANEHSRIKNITLKRIADALEKQSPAPNGGK